MRKDPFSKLKSAINKSKTISIITHWSPDGDAMGSSLGLYHFLVSLNKNVKVIVPNDYPKFLKWLPGDKSVINHQQKTKTAEKFILESDIVFTLDFNTLARIEKLGDVVSKNKTAVKILVDHHQQPENYAQLVFHDTSACSTCELIYELICGIAGKKVITKKIATCLYTGIMTDSGNFRFPAVTANTHKIVACLIEAGANNNSIYSLIHEDHSETRMRLMGYCLNEKLKIIKEYNTGYICLTEKELTKFNFEKGDTEGLVNYALSISGIKFSAFFAEKDGMFKISFRSKGKFDVNKFARNNWNGGGHKNAAGGQFKSTDLDACEKKFMDELTNYKIELQ